MGLILPSWCLLLCPIPLKKGETLCRRVPLPRGDLDLSSLASLDTFENIVLLEGPDSLSFGPGFWSSVSTTGPGESGLYSGLLGT